MVRIQNAENERIRPVVYAIALYFVLAGVDSFRIGSVGSLLKIIALVPLVFAILDLKNLRIRFSPAVVFQMLFLLLSAISLFYSIGVNKSFTSLKTLALNLSLVFCLGMMEQYNQRELRFMKNALLAGGWVTILMMLVFSDYSTGGRLTLLLGSETQDQNYINGYFLYTFSWHCSRLLLDKRKAHIIPTASILTIVLLTGSRGALLAFILVLFVQLCINFARTKHTFRNILLTVFLIGVLFAVFDFALSQMPENIAQRFSWDYIEEKGTTGRSRIWAYLLQHFSRDSIPRMLFGHGYGTTVFVNPYGKVAHNLYIEVLIAIGIVGLSLVLAMQGATVWILLKHRQYPLLGAYLGMLCMCLSLSLIAYKPIWNIMLLALAIDFYEKSNCDCSVRSSQYSPNFTPNP